MTSPLFVDVYPGDRRCDWAAFCAAGAPWSGAIFKASQGLRYSYLEWLTHNRSQLREAAGDRYGVDVFDGMYHYLELNVDGAKQAEFFWHNVEASGGERIGTLWGAVDVEAGGQAIKNPSRAQVEDCTRAFATRYQQISGRTATLYGGSLLRDVGVKDRLDCGRSWVALYGAELHGKGESTVQFLTRTGTDVEHLMLWQYTAAESSGQLPAHFPDAAPGCGKVDISALTLPGGLAVMRSTLWAERPISPSR